MTAVSGADAPLLAVDGLTVRFDARLALDAVSLQADAGRTVALLGPNGAGKSTLVRCISGQRRPDGGTVRLGGEDPVASAHARARIGIVPQSLAVFPALSVSENLRAFAELLGVPAARVTERTGVVLERIGLAHRSRDRAGDLSGGMQRLLNLGAALLHEPALLLLDEPTVGIDRQARFRFRDLLRVLRAEGLTILLTTHELEEAELLAEELVVLADGRLVAAGRTDALLGDTFGDRRELLVTVNGDEGAGPPAPLAERFRALGLEDRDEEGLWRGLVTVSDPDCQALFGACREPDSGVVDFRLRRPGLGRLLDHLKAAGGSRR